MNIVLAIILLGLLDELPEVPAAGRYVRRAITEQACIRRRNTAMVALGDGLEEGKIKIRSLPRFDKSDNTRWKVSHRWDTYYFKGRSIIDNGRVHAGDKRRKGKRPYGKEPLDKIRFKQAMEDYLDS